MGGPGIYQWMLRGGGWSWDLPVDVKRGKGSRDLPVDVKRGRESRDLPVDVKRGRGFQGFTS